MVQLQHLLLVSVTAVLNGVLASALAQAGPGAQPAGGSASQSVDSTKYEDEQLSKCDFAAINATFVTPDRDELIANITALCPGHFPSIICIVHDEIDDDLVHIAPSVEENGDVHTYCPGNEALAVSQARALMNASLPSPPPAAAAAAAVPNHNKRSPSLLPPPIMPRQANNQQWHVYANESEQFSDIISFCPTLLPDTPDANRTAAFLVNLAQALGPAKVKTFSIAARFACGPSIDPVTFFNRCLGPLANGQSPVRSSRIHAKASAKAHAAYDPAGCPCATNEQPL
ncbi:MAG: hypothetical protein M1838_005120 [Thelocarpon superellum]|nr:MAG: hypothetical protein M1838_005120 [Thelocarpon superellum]